jgi:O-antigen ligase
VGNQGGWWTRAVWWRIAVGVSFSAAVLRSGVFVDTGSSLVWYAAQFGPIVAVAVLMLLTPAPRNMRRVDWVILGALGAVVATALLSAITSISPSATLAQAGILALMAAFVGLTFWRRWSDRELIRGDMVVVFALVVVVELAGLVSALFQAPFAIGDYGRYTGLLSNANYAGMLACVAIPLAVFVYRRSSRWLAVVGGVVSVVSLILSGSRGALLACAAGLVALIVFLPKRKMLMAAGGVVAAVVVYLIAAPLLTKTVAQTFTRESQSSDVTSGRVGIWAEMIDGWLRAPLTGYGYHTTDTLTDGLSGHNTYLAALTETGILGAMALAVALVAILFAGQRRTPDRLLVATVISIGVMEATESSIFGWGGPTALVSWLILLAFAASGRDELQPESAPPDQATPARIA